MGWWVVWGGLGWWVVCMGVYIYIYGMLASRLPSAESGKVYAEPSAFKPQLGAEADAHTPVEKVCVHVRDTSRFVEMGVTCSACLIHAKAAGRSDSVRKVACESERAEIATISMRTRTGSQPSLVPSRRPCTSP